MATMWAMVAHLSRLDCVGCEPEQPVGLYGVALLSLGLGAMLVGLCCLCCVGCCAKRRYSARRRRAVPEGAAGAAGAAEGLQLADAHGGDEALPPSEVEQSAAAPAPAARQRLKSRMEAAGTAKLLNACPSDAAGYEDDAESPGGEGRTTW